MPKCSNEKKSILGFSSPLSSKANTKNSYLLLTILNLAFPTPDYFVLYVYQLVNEGLELASKVTVVRPLTGYE